VKLFTRNASITPARKPIPLVQDSQGTPAVDLTKVESAGHVDLVKRSRKAGISLSKRGLAGIRAQAVLVLDHSGSMRTNYQAGKVQTLVERVLGFALQIDIDGVIPIIPFDSIVHPTVNVGVTSGAGVEGYQGVVDRCITGHMGLTDLGGALEEVRRMAQKTDAPMFVVIVTDGSPYTERGERHATHHATDMVIDLARYPVFLKFVAIEEVPYLADLDNMDPARRLLDNVDAKTFEDPAAVSDLVFADAMVDEWDTWVSAATAAGVLA